MLVLVVQLAVRVVSRVELGSREVAVCYSVQLQCCSNCGPTDCVAAACNCRGSVGVLAARAALAASRSKSLAW